MSDGEPLFRPNPEGPRYFSETGTTLTSEILARALDKLWHKPAPPSLTEDFPALANLTLLCQVMLRDELVNPWKYLDWTVQADGYRLVIEDGAMAGLAYDEFPWPWGDPRYDDAALSWASDGPFPDSVVLAPGVLGAQFVTGPRWPGVPYKYFGMCDG
jgi:hypothetical protein